ncbi:MAG TPA: Holliday junction resolvase RuvX [Methylomirabilota bacterium]|nr:Holliday junction resolvase RuvX [Methylomirabilota bacterium]
MRILSLDHGTRRIGVAVSDEMKIIATPLEHIPAEPMDKVLERLQQLIREKEVEFILIGMPRNMDGTHGAASQKVKDFIASLQPHITVPFKPWDERLTSVMANRALLQGNVRRNQRKEKVDKMAAAILLQSYLDSRPE